MSDRIDVLELLRTARPNMLIVGSDVAADAAIRRLSHRFATPLHTCSLPGPLTLPSMNAGTLLFRDVAALDPVQQQEFLQWLDGDGGRTQIVSVTSKSLYSQVVRGDFSERLYYRLNTVLEDLSSTS